MGADAVLDRSATEKRQYRTSFCRPQQPLPTGRRL